MEVQLISGMDDIGNNFHSTVKQSCHAEHIKNSFIDCQIVIDSFVNDKLLAMQSEICKMNFSNLRKRLKQLSLPHLGTKSDLIDRLLKYETINAKEKIFQNFKDKDNNQSDSSTDLKANLMSDNNQPESSTDLKANLISDSSDVIMKVEEENIVSSIQDIVGEVVEQVVEHHCCLCLEPVDNMLDLINLFGKDECCHNDYYHIDCLSDYIKSVLTATTVKLPIYCPGREADDVRRQCKFQFSDKFIRNFLTLCVDSITDVNNANNNNNNKFNFLQNYELALLKMSESQGSFYLTCPSCNSSFMFDRKVEVIPIIFTCPIVSCSQIFCTGCNEIFIKPQVKGNKENKSNMDSNMQSTMESNMLLEEMPSDEIKEPNDNNDTDAKNKQPKKKRKIAGKKKVAVVEEESKVELEDDSKNNNDSKNKDHQQYKHKVRQEVNKHVTVIENLIFSDNDDAQNSNNENLRLDKFIQSHKSRCFNENIHAYYDTTNIIQMPEGDELTVENLARFIRAQVDLNVSRCPACKVAAEKIDNGCNFIHCECGIGWCFVCEKIIPNRTDEYFRIKQNQPHLSAFVLRTDMNGNEREVILEDVRVDYYYHYAYSETAQNKIYRHDPANPKAANKLCPLYISNYCSSDSGYDLPEYQKFYAEHRGSLTEDNCAKFFTFKKQLNAVFSIAQRYNLNPAEWSIFEQSMILLFGNSSNEFDTSIRLNFPEIDWSKHTQIVRNLKNSQNSETLKESEKQLKDNSSTVVVDELLNQKPVEAILNQKPVEAIVNQKAVEAIVNPLAVNRMPLAAIVVNNVNLVKENDDSDIINSNEFYKSKRTIICYLQDMYDTKCQLPLTLSATIQDLCITLIGKVSTKEHDEGLDMLDILLYKSHTLKLYYKNHFLDTLDSKRKFSEFDIFNNAQQQFSLRIKTK